MFRKRSFRLRLFVGIIALLLIVLSVPADAGTRRILLVGDSWPAFMWEGVPSIYSGRCMLDALNARGYGQWEEWGQYTTFPASFAFTGDAGQGSSWAKNNPSGFGGLGMLDVIKRELLNNPSIDIVHICMGGNDYGRADYSPAIDYTEYGMQSLVVSGTLTGGTFTITFNGATINPPLAYSAAAADIQAALNGLSSVSGAGGNVVVTDTTGGARFFCQFGGALAGTAVPMMTVDNSALVGGMIAPFGVTFGHGWEKAWGTNSPAESAFFNAVAGKVRDVIESTLDVRPGVRVCLCDYDLMDVAGGGGTVEDYNEGGMRLGYCKLLMTQSVSRDPRYLNRCWFLGPCGLMQYHYGYPNPLPSGDTLLYGAHDDTPLIGPDPMGNPIPPAGTLGYVSLPGGPLTTPPFTPLLGGDSRYPSPVISVLPDVGGANMHLEREGYVFLSKYCVDQLYGAWLDLPVVLAVKRITPNPVNAGQIYNPAFAQQLAFEIDFSKPVTGVDENNVVINATGNVSGARILSVSPTNNGGIYIAIVDRGVGEGSLGITVLDDGTIKDSGGTDLAGNISGTFTLGEQYTIDHSAALPVVAWPALMGILVLGARVVRRRK